MNKQKIVTIYIVVLILVVVGGLFIYGNKNNKSTTIVPVIDTKLPPLENKDKILGNKDDLISFTILPGTKVHGILSYRGIIKGGYFFEGNIYTNNKK